MRKFKSDRVDTTYARFENAIAGAAIEAIDKVERPSIVRAVNAGIVPNPHVRIEGAFGNIIPASGSIAIVNRPLACTAVEFFRKNGSVPVRVGVRMKKTAR